MAGLTVAVAAYTLPASSDSVVRYVGRNTASCMYSEEKSSSVKSEERSDQVIRPLLPIYVGRSSSKVS